VKAAVIAVLVACSPAPLPPRPAPVTPPPVATASGTSIVVGDLDRSADPCTDFYQFATGGWRSANPIPAGKPKWSRRMAAREANRRDVEAVLAELAQGGDHVAGDFYASCLDEAGAESAGVEPIAPLLDTIATARTLPDVQRAIRRLHDLGIAVPFGFVADLDVHEPTRTLPHIVAGGIGLPDRDYYSSNDPKLVDARHRYRAYIAKLLELSGSREAGKDADAIVALETRLAAASLPAQSAADPAATDHPMTWGQMVQLAPSFDWDGYAAAVHVTPGDVIVAEPAYMKALDKELTKTPVAVWKAYLRWHVLDVAAPWLAKRFAGVALDYRGESRPRATRCTELAEQWLPEPVGAAYSARHFTPAARAKVLDMAHAMLEILADDVATESWMTFETKAKALVKLKATSVEAGYREHRHDTSALAIHRGAPWPSIAAAREFAVEIDRARNGDRTAADLWQLPPSSPDAYIEPLLVQMVLPAGYLQRPIFDVDATDAFNYGAIGISMAHDFTHAIDRSGSEVDAKGRPVNWWTDADRDGFAGRGRCVADQFAAYEIEPGVHLDGAKILSEAIGDLAGIRVAYAALEKSLAAHPEPIVDGFTPEQQFFLAWAQFRGDDVRLEAQRQMIAGDTHPVPRFRINGILADSPEFARAFACKPGAAMVRAPDKRCVVW
jgi:endothelin-converting enzyme/putative endopeptidase